MQDVQVNNWLKQIVNLESLLDATESGILIIDMDRKVRFINEKAQKLLGYQIGEVYGHRCNIIARTSDCENNCPLTRTIQSGSEVRLADMQYTARNNKSFQAQTSIVLLKDEVGNVVAGAEIFRDVSHFIALEEKIRGRFSFHDIIGKSHKMREIYRLIEEVAPTDASILIQGESGTGKELIASAIHAYSTRKNTSFVKVNSSAFPEGLLESELFGHTRGAFTGAYQEKKGKFEIADGGTIFLDEIGEMSPLLQVKLLRVLQDGELQRVGENKPRKVNVRIIAATNKDLKKAIVDREFREDLYYRVNVVPIFLPPLRERKTDIPLLITHFLRELNRSTKEKYVEKVSSKATDILMRYNFPGNVRELQNIIEFAYIRCNSGIIEPIHLPTEFLENDFTADSVDSIDRILRSDEPLKKAQKEIIERVLEEENGKYMNAAKRLGMSRTTLWRKLKELQIDTGEKK
jgi:sigma-54 dependent transcriptional regulator, acetoin dehydrogenase operon transcriptional activator AcoR